MKYNKILILVLIAVLAGVGILKVGLDTKRDIKDLKSNAVTVTSPKLIQAELIIEKEDPIEGKVKIRSGGTVFDLLQKSGVEFEYEQYDSGAFITSIEGVSNPTKNWMYYVNEKLGQKAVDKKKINAGDVVRFKNQKAPF